MTANASPAGADRAHWEQTVERALRELENNGYFSKGLPQRVRKLVAEYRNRRTGSGP